MKLTLLAYLVFTNFLIARVGATSFHPVSVEKLITSSDAILVGDFLEAKTVMLEDGLIATEARFKLEQEWGLHAEEYGMSEVIVFFPGGTFEGKTTHVDGAPHFVVGEKNVLMLHAAQDGSLWVQGLASGTFKVVKVGPQRILINPVFPSHPTLGRFPLERFHQIVTEVKGHDLREVHSDKYVREWEKERERVFHRKGNSRSIASVAGPSDNVRKADVVDNFWLLTMMAVLGAFFAWRARHKTE